MATCYLPGQRGSGSGRSFRPGDCGAPVGWLCCRWRMLRGLMGHFTEPRFASVLRNLTPPREYALVWRATLSAAGLFAQLGATVPTRGFHLAYSPGFREGTRVAQPLFSRSGQSVALRALPAVARCFCHGQESPPGGWRRAPLRACGTRPVGFTD